MEQLPYKFKIEQVIKEGRCNQSQIESIRNWLEKFLENYKTIPDETIALFLLSCNLDINETKKTIENFVRVKKSYPEMFNERDIDSNSKLLKATKTIISVSMPVRLPGNDVIHFFKLQDTNYSSFDLTNAMKLAYMVIDVSQRENPPNRLVVIMDMKGAGIMHLTKFKVAPVKTFLEFLQTAMPLRISQVYILNANYMFDKILNLAKAFIKSELMTLIKSYPPGYDMSEFHKTEIGKEYLPEEYGGDLPNSLQLHEKTVQVFRELKEFFVIEENLRKNI